MSLGEKIAVTLFIVGLALFLGGVVMLCISGGPSWVYEMVASCIMVVAIANFIVILAEKEKKKEN
ncbi:hypothetical protein AKJ62_04035 [candidate division MSBL1 archaeon SCGC-AAA259D14]|uniref:Uncharacterized protein n=1 Tax=candidate division MSBL1 archaeon SCGC-AAA259D14 TaxID=1698261 RepID=A0A133U463_9EURY|nr:hypothetical protein AKJ62_04035 [candidate division MSBL1 archaeon SCGC-AAA259D14]